MQSTSQNNTNRQNIIPSVKPEIIEFFQREINSHLTPAQIKNIINSLDPELNPKPNPIQGEIVNLLYLQKGNNLVAFVIQEDNTSNLYTLSAESNLVAEANAIRIDNLKDFQFRLQDVFNHNSLISIYYEDNRIESLVIIKQEQNNQLSLKDEPFSTISKKTKCHFPPNLC